MQANHGNEILLVSPDRLGDLVWTLPAIDHIRQCFPDARISFLGSAYAGGLLEGHSGIDRLYRIRRDARHIARYLEFQRFLQALDQCPPDRIFLFRVGREGRALTKHFRNSEVRSIRELPAQMRATQHQCNVRKIFVEQLCEQPIEGNGFPHLNIPQPYLEKAHAECAQHQLDPSRCVALHPGVNRLIRRRSILRRSANRVTPRLWPTEHWVALAKELLRLGLTPVFTGSGGEAEICETFAARVGPGAVSMAKKQPLLKFAGFCSLIAGVVASDTGPSHLASAVGTPVVALFGPTNPFRTAPLAPESLRRILWHPTKCVACRNQLGEDSANHSCMETIRVAEVIASLRELRCLGSSVGSAS